MSEEKILEELRIDRYLRQLQAEGEEANKRFDARLVAAAECEMFGEEQGTVDVIAANRQNFFKTKLQNPWTSPRRDNSDDEPEEQTLEKRASNSRRREALKAFVARQLALGVPFEQIVAGAEENDLPTATLMREVYEELALES
jgi:hypothetical protein